MALKLAVLETSLPLCDIWWKIKVNWMLAAPSESSYIYEGSKNVLLETDSSLSFWQ